MPVIVGSRDEKRAQKVAAEISSKAGTGAEVEGLENTAACQATNLLVLTIPFEGHAGLLKELKPHFQPSTTLIDATVPLAATVGGRASRTLGLWQGSAAQETAELVPQGVIVVAAFQNISADALNGDADVECDVIICSDDKHALQQASDLAERIPGVRAVNGGKLENARVLEQITALLVGINIRYKVHGAGIRITGLPARKSVSPE
jgi:NADPH-dependent F420 reductase